MKSGAFAALGAAAVAVIAGGYMLWGKTDDAVEKGAMTAPAGDAALVALSVPRLSERAEMGKLAFDAKCAACHGVNAAGLDGAGPPLVHKIYEPGHHGDMAFMLAPRRGVRAHHWRFGDMPPVEGLTDADIGLILTYVRELQRANGIY